MQKRSDQEIDEIIDAIKDIKRAEISPFFKSKLNIKLKATKFKEDSNLVSYYILIAVSMVLMICNTFFLRQNFNITNQESRVNHAEVYENIYQLNTTTYNYDNKK